MDTREFSDEATIRLEVQADGMPVSASAHDQTHLSPPVPNTTHDNEATLSKNVEHQGTIAIKPSDTDSSSSPPHEKGATGSEPEAEIKTMYAKSPPSSDSHAASGFLEIGNTIELSRQKYHIIRRLGKKSGESQVYLLQYDDDEYVVLKYYYPGLQPKMHIIQDLMRLNHPGLLRLLDSGYYRGQFFELLEYASGGDLLQYAPIKDIDILKLVVAETAEALKFCHQNKIVHRDIKPDNLFFKTAARLQVVIGDFGISSKIANDDLNQLTSQNRTPVYAAPEVYQSIAGKTVIQPEVDYYCLGMSLLCLWTGSNPFKGMNEFQIMQIKTQGRIPPPDDMPENWRQLIKGLLTVRTNHRWGYAELQRWLMGESVPVFDSPGTIYFKPFKFGTTVTGDPLEASSPTALAELIREYPDKGIRYLQNGAIKNWLEQHGEQEMALDVSHIMELHSGTNGAKIVAYTLDPNISLLFMGRQISSLPLLAQAIYGEPGEWQDGEWPSSYQKGLELLEGGEMQAWLKAQRQEELVLQWSTQPGATASTQGLESMLRLLDPTIPPVQLRIDDAPLKQPHHIRQGALLELPMTYRTEGPGVPFAEVSVYRNEQRKPLQLIKSRQGNFTVKLGTFDDKAYQKYQIRLVITPDDNTILNGGSWDLTYKVTYPWRQAIKPLFKAGIMGALVGLAFRGPLAYKYPQPLASYLGTTYTPAVLNKVKEPFLDYTFCGWLFGFLILLKWIRQR